MATDYREIIRDLLYTLHVEVPAEDQVPVNQNLTGLLLSNPTNKSSETN